MRHTGSALLACVVFLAAALACQEERHLVGGPAAVSDAAPPDASPRLRIEPIEAVRRTTNLVWKSPPDDQLTARAANDIRTNDDVAALVPSLLADPRAEAGMRAFYDWWLALAGLSTLEKDPATYPEWGDTLRSAMAEETRLFAVDVTLHDGRFQTLLGARESFINAALAAIYGIPNVPADAFVKMPLPATRAGLLTQPALLSITRAAKYPSPIQRGVYVLGRLVCPKFEPPPLTPDQRQPPAGSEPTRQYVDQLTSGPCQGCHGIINPPGFSFTNFDAIGRERAFDSDGKTPADTQGEFTVNGRQFRFKDAVELAGELAGDEIVHRCFTSKWFEHALGRPVGDGEQSAIDVAFRGFAASGLDIRALIAEVVRSDPFLSPP